MHKIRKLFKRLNLILKSYILCYNYDLLNEITQNIKFCSIVKFYSIEELMNNNNRFSNLLFFRVYDLENNATYFTEHLTELIRHYKYILDDRKEKQHQPIFKISYFHRLLKLVQVG